MGVCVRATLCKFFNFHQKNNFNNTLKLFWLLLFYLFVGGIDIKKTEKENLYIINLVATATCIYIYQQQTTVDICMYKFKYQIVVYWLPILLQCLF